LILSGLALACVFFVFQGRTGHLIAVALITLAIVWELPSRFRIAALAVPFVLVFGLTLSSGKVNQRLLQLGRDVSAFERSGNTSTSSGDRLNLWNRSLDSISEHPWYGSGVGSWNSEFNRQEAVHAPTLFVKVGGNPHQEYLLWGVELGVPGIALLLAIMLAVYRDSLRLQQPERRALQSVLLSLILACLFNCSLHDALIGDFFCVALALMLTLGVHATASARVTSATAHDV
jgi:O-antigen ligase